MDPDSVDIIFAIFLQRAAGGGGSVALGAGQAPGGAHALEGKLVNLVNLTYSTYISR